MPLTKVTYSMIFGACVNVQDFGAVGDGTTDDTTAINLAIAKANATQQTLYFPVTTGNYKITSALTAITSVGGVEMESVAYSSSGVGAILVSGTGYTAVTIQSNPSRCNLAVVGTGNTANGVLLQNPQGGRFGKIRVMNLNGFGVKINKCWDCTFEHIMTELCGNATEYAFSMNDDGDTCNMSHIMCLQVEQSNKKAIFISANTLCCVIDNIHSERATPQAGVHTWVLGGNDCTYNNVRCESNVPSADSYLYISSASSTFINLRAEGSIPVWIESYSNSETTLISPKIYGSLSAITNQTGLINVFGGEIEYFISQASKFKFNNTIIHSVTIGYANSDPKLCNFNNCTIDILISSDSTSAATFNNCVILECNSFLESYSVLNNTNSTSASTIVIDYESLITNNSTINGNISIDTGTIIASNTVINGNLTQSAGSVSSTFDDSTYCTGTVAGLGVPAAGTWSKGQYSKNINPVVGQPKGWICTVSGTPGTWVSLGNL